MTCDGFLTCASVAPLLIGSNDGTNDGAGGHATPEQVLATIDAIVAELRALGIVTVTCTIPYRQAGGWGNNLDFNGWADIVNAAIRAAGHGGRYGDRIADTNAALVAAGGYANYLDATHPNPTGTQAMTDVIQPEVDIAIPLAA